MAKTDERVKDACFPGESGYPATRAPLLNYRRQRIFDLIGVLLTRWVIHSRTVLFPGEDMRQEPLVPRGDIRMSKDIMPLDMVLAEVYALRFGAIELLAASLIFIAACQLIFLLAGK